MAKKTAGPSSAVLKMMESEEKKEAAEMAESVKAVQTAFPDLIKYANELADLSDDIDKKEDVVKDLKARKDHLRKVLIPDLMKKAGLVNSQNKGSFTIPGRKIYLETRVNASVTEAMKPALFAWLRKQKLGDMIKEVVHSQTLSAFVRGRREDGLTVPPTVSVHEETVAKVMKV